jgi:hypothetical protein
MKSTSINKVIDDFNSLVLEEKEFALDIIRKILVESKRESLFSRARKADSNFRKGKVKRGTAKDLFKDLEND